MNQKKWQEVTGKWESSSTQDVMHTIMQPFRYGTPKHQPYISQFIAILFSFASTIYHYAYQYDNFTCVLYNSKYYELSHNYFNCDDFQAEYAKLDKLLSLMPKGFVDFEINCGTLLIPAGTCLTIQKANEILDFIASDEFIPILRIISANKTNFQAGE